MICKYESSITKKNKSYLVLLILQLLRAYYKDNKIESDRSSKKIFYLIFFFPLFSLIKSDPIQSIIAFCRRMKGVHFDYVECSSYPLKIFVYFLSISKHTINLYFLISSVHNFFFRVHDGLINATGVPKRMIST